jgi:hypothetical protein
MADSWKTSRDAKEHRLEAYAPSAFRTVERSLRAIAVCIKTGVQPRSKLSISINLVDIRSLADIGRLL